MNRKRKTKSMRVRERPWVGKRASKVCDRVSEGKDQMLKGSSSSSAAIDIKNVGGVNFLVLKTKLEIGWPR